jgi:hypothetical protein
METLAETDLHPSSGTRPELRSRQRLSLAGLLRRLPPYRGLRHMKMQGVAYTLRRRRVESKILRTRSIYTSPLDVQGTAPCEVRILTYEADYLMALWAAKSFYYYAGVEWPLVWQQGGALSPRCVRLLHDHFPNSTFLPMAETDALVEGALHHMGLDATAAVRRNAPYFRKPIDFRILSRCPKALFLDTDVLFFCKPNEILSAVHAGSQRNYFNQDANNGYPMAPDEAEKRFGVRPIERLNAGLGLVCRESIDLKEVDRYLQDPDMLRSKFFTDQLVYALLGATFATELLPNTTYVLSGEPGLDVLGASAIARHYAGTTRPLMYREGIPRLIEQKFLRDLGP